MMKEYKQKYAAMLMEYTALNTGYEDRITRIIKGGIPSLTKFASMINVSRRTLDKWAEENPTFRQAVEEARYRIADIIEDAAAVKAIDSGFSKFILTEKFGYGNEEKNDSDMPFELNITVIK